MINGVSHLEVLLIEDNPGDIALIEASLAETGFGGITLHSVHRLADGLDLLRRTRIDVILLDLSLPDSDGLATLGRVRSEAPGVPVLILTGYDDPETGALAVRAGAQDYLIKGETGGLALAHAMVFAIERQRAGELLASELELLRAIERSVPFCISAVDLEGRQIYVNPRFCELTGWPREELLGDLSPYWPVQDMLSVENSAPVSVRLRTRNGEKVSVRLSVQPLRKANGDRLGWLSIFDPLP